MSRKVASSALAMGALILGLANTATAMEGCVPVSGKIFNNFAAPDGSATIGVVAMVYGTKKEKLKCALSGTPDPDFPTPEYGTIRFIHSISCDDQMPAQAFDGNIVPVHSSIVLRTAGYTLDAKDPDTQLNSFRETSILLPGAPARGRFLGATGGQIEVEGVVFKSQVPGVPGSIDMNFSGEVCYGSAG